MCSKNIRIDRINSLLKKETKKLRIPSVAEGPLEFKDPFYVLISCILSLYTKDNRTRAASKGLFQLADGLKDMEKLSLNEIQDVIYPVGFYRVKAKNIKKSVEI